METRRSAVFIVPNHIVGHELVFKHYTNKVVVGNFTGARTNKIQDTRDVLKQNLRTLTKLR